MTMTSKTPTSKATLWRKVAAGVALVSAAMLTPAVQAATSTTAKTRYPIVLVHGMAGFDSIMGIDYFYKVPDELRKNGATVYIASVSSFNDNDVRGEQLLKQMKQWAAAKGYTKFNIIAHSQGGPTARYVHGVAPNMVASITSVGSPHDLTHISGSDPVAEFMANNTALVSIMGSVIGWASGSSNLPQDPAALNAWASNTGAYNDRFPAGRPATYCGEGAEKVGDTYFYSATGNQPSTNSWDISDPLLVKAGANAGEPTDGITPVCAAHWGKVLRDDYPWNHLDEINHILGLIGKGAPDPVAFYVQQASRLKAKGL